MGFRLDIDLTGGVWIGGRSCFGAIGNDSVKCIVLRGSGKLCSGGGGEVRAGGGKHGILTLVVESFSTSSSEVLSSFGIDDDKVGPSGILRCPGDGGPVASFGV